MSTSWAQNNPSASLEYFEATAATILATQLSSGAIPWFEAGKIDPWDHVEAAMGLASMNHIEAAVSAYDWLADQQTSSGGWYVAYDHTGVTDDSRIETNFVAYVAVGIWHLYLVTKDRDLLGRYWDMVNQAINFVIERQAPTGEIYWAEDKTLGLRKDALVTGCSSIYLSLLCGTKIAAALTKPQARWQQSAKRLRVAITDHPEAFDRTWPSKARFSMDWFYPVLTGVITEDNARSRIDARWNEFVVSGLGCRCVNDEPWVTIAETCELVMSLSAIGDFDRANALFEWIQQFRADDGSYWTGYVYKDEVLWPDERTTWTAGAVLLASDTLTGRTAGSQLFLADR